MDDNEKASNFEQLRDRCWGMILCIVDSVARYCVQTSGYSPDHGIVISLEHLLSQCCVKIVFYHLGLVNKELIQPIACQER